MIYGQLCHRLLLLLLAAFLLSCAEKSLTTDPGDNPSDRVSALIITTITPNPVSIGGELIIDGENFGSDASAVKVYIGDVEAEVKSVTPTRIIVVVPDGAHTGNGVVKVVKNGKNVQSNDSLTVLASPFLYREAVVTITGIDLEYSHADKRQAKPDTSYVRREGFVLQQPVNADSIYTSTRPPSEMKWCQDLSHGDTVMLYCSKYESGIYGWMTYDQVSFRFTAVIDTLRKTLTRVYYDYLHAAYRSGDVETDTSRIALHDMPYTEVSPDNLIAEIRGEKILDHLTELYDGQRRQNGNMSYDLAARSLRIALVKPDGVVRVVLTP